MLENLTKYLATYAPVLLGNAKVGYAESGRGALVITPQVQNEHGMADVRYHTLAMFQEDHDPIAPTVETYDPETQAVVMALMTAPSGVFSFLTDGQRMDLVEADVPFLMHGVTHLSVTA